MGCMAINGRYRGRVHGCLQLSVSASGWKALLVIKDKVEYTYMIHKNFK